MFRSCNLNEGTLIGTSVDLILAFNASLFTVSPLKTQKSSTVWALFLKKKKKNQFREKNQRMCAWLGICPPKLEHYFQSPTQWDIKNHHCLLFKENAFITLQNAFMKL